jgi:hypothetical protein
MYLDAMSRLAFAAILLVGCGDDEGGTAPDATPDAAPPDAPTVRVGPVVELPLLEPLDPAFPAIHSNEASLAARGGTVVVSYVNRPYLSLDSWENQGELRADAVAVSHDAGETFALVPQDGPFPTSSDPVVRIGAQGPFWLVRLHVEGEWPCSVRTSPDGSIWTALPDLACGDKPWLAVDPTGDVGWVASDAGWARIPLDGSPPATLPMFIGTAGNHKATAGFVDAEGAHMLSVGSDDGLFEETEFEVARWDGVNPEVVELDDLPGSFGRDNTVTLFSASMGRTVGGSTWILHTDDTDNVPNVVVTLLDAAGATTVPLSAPGGTAFHPAGALDGEGRLHTIWYETSGPAGVLMYTRSRSADLTQGFENPIVIDDDATPGAGWTPVGETFRLREYIDLAVDGARIHMAWTHAPAPPSRVVTRWLEHL